MTYLVTGAAGFIGFHVANHLLNDGHEVVGIDNINDYYSTKLKEARIAELEKHEKFAFYKDDICNYEKLTEIAKKHNFQAVIHLAAQPGVRYSLENPFAYVKSNLEGHLSILELCRHNKHIKRLIYASSSSVYGNNKKSVSSIEDNVDEPISLYAATKKSDELMTYTYCHLYGMKAIGLRFFTVYGPWGRPDMATYKFTDAIFHDKPIDLYNHGDMKRDFTYIDDIVNGILACINSPLKGHKVYNLGNNKPEELKEYVSVLEKSIDKKAIINSLPMQPGDLKETCADITESEHDLGYSPKTSIHDGLPKTVEWHKKYHKI